MRSLLGRLAKLRAEAGREVPLAEAVACMMDAGRNMGVAALILEYREVWRNMPEPPDPDCQKWAREQAWARWNADRLRKELTRRQW